MTCEISIMNRQAIALAADSASTVTQWVNGSLEKRFFKGTNKIFQLSDYHPVGVMIYGSADIHKVPWELVIKDFRRYLADKSFNDLPGYASEFFSFICKHNKFFPEDMKRDVFVEMAARAAAIGLVIDASKSESVKKADSDTKRKKAIEDFLKNSLLEIETEEIPNCFNERDVEAAVLEQGEQVEQAISGLVKGIPNVGAEDFKGWAELGIKRLIKNHKAYMEMTGVVVSGYGDHDYYPAYQEYACYGLILGQIMYDQKRGAKIALNHPSDITAFATTDMVDTFSLGISPDVFDCILEEQRHALQALAESIRLELDVEEIENLDKYIDGIYEKSKERWWSDVVSAHYAPLSQVLGSLPIEEMADLAETLISLQSLKEKVTKPTESVGGPIDVAVISKFDGFIWIRRKHYFSGDLNPRFFHQQASKFK